MLAVASGEVIPMWVENEAIARVGVKRHAPAACGLTVS